MLAGRTYRAPYDLTAKIVSTLVSVSMLALAAVVHNIYLAGLSVLIVLAAYAYSVGSYGVAEGSIVVRRLAGLVRIPLADVREARRAGPEDFRGCIRLWGSGGLFGYYGLFQTSRLGRCTWYVTDRTKAVVVKTDAKTVLYSPDDVDGFLAEIHVGAPGAAREAPTDALEIHSRAAGIGMGAVGILVALAAGTLVLFSARYSPGPPDYTLTRDTLAIHDRFYPVTLGASSVDATAMRVVDLTEESGWRPTVKTGGFSNSHYRSGWFRAKNGRSMRLYWAGATRVVLLPSKSDGAPVLMEVAEPDAFVEQARQEWSRGR